MFAVYRSYGDPFYQRTTIYGCLRPGSPVRLQHFADGDDAALSLIAFAGNYVAFREAVTDPSCARYNPYDPQCTSIQLVSFDLRSGHRRVKVSGQDTPDLVLVPHGWIAWIVPASCSGPATVQVVDSLGRRTLDDGPVRPKSLRASRSRIFWQHDDGARQTCVT